MRAFEFLPALAVEAAGLALSYAEAVTLRENKIKLGHVSSDTPKAVRAWPVRGCEAITVSSYFSEAPSLRAVQLLSTKG
jgi:hypothetical protein